MGDSGRPEKYDKKPLDSDLSRKTRRRRGAAFSSTFFKVCLVLIFLNTIVEKTYPEP